MTIVKSQLFYFNPKKVDKRDGWWSVQGGNQAVSAISGRSLWGPSSFHAIKAFLSDSWVGGTTWTECQPHNKLVLRMVVDGGQRGPGQVLMQGEGRVDGWVVWAAVLRFGKKCTTPVRPKYVGGHRPLKEAGVPKPPSPNEFLNSFQTLVTRLGKKLLARSQIAAGLGPPPPPGLSSREGNLTLRKALCAMPEWSPN